MKILTASHILPISSPPFLDGAVVIENDKIIEIGPQKKVLERYDGKDVEDFGRSVLMPGLVNADTELDLFNFDGKGFSGERLEFLDWLLASWKYRNKLNPADRRQALESGIRQLLLSGTTCVADSGYYVGMIPQAANSPIRMVLSPILLMSGDSVAMENYEAALSQVEEIRESQSDHLLAGLAPYAAFTLSRHLLKIAAEETKRLNILLRIHASESFSEMQFFFESSGEIFEKIFPAMGWSDQRPPEHRKTPLQYLESIGFLESGPLITGCHHLAEPDYQILARSKTKVVFSPRSCERLKLGMPPIKKLRKLKIPVALGTARTGSLFSLSLWDEMRQVMALGNSKTRPTESDLLSMVTLEGAISLGLSDRIGSLEAGKQADLIAVKIPSKLPLKDLPEALIQNTTEREISAVFVGGKRLHG